MNSWQKYYSLPKVIVIVTLMVFISIISYVIALDIISESNVDATDLLLAINNNVNHFFGNIVFFVWLAFVFGVMLSIITIYFVCMFNPKRTSKKTQRTV